MVKKKQHFFDERRYSYYIYINKMYNQYKEDEK